MFIFYEVISLLYYSQIKFHLNLLNSVIYTSVWEHNEQSSFKYLHNLHMENYIYTCDSWYEKLFDLATHIWKMG